MNNVFPPHYFVIQFWAIISVHLLPTIPTGFPLWWLHERRFLRCRMKLNFNSGSERLAKMASSFPSKITFFFLVTSLAEKRRYCQTSRTITELLRRNFILERTRLFFITFFEIACVSGLMCNLKQSWIVANSSNFTLFWTALGGCWTDFSLNEWDWRMQITWHFLSDNRVLAVGVERFA